MCTKKFTFAIYLLFSVFFVFAQATPTPAIGVYDCGLNYQTPLLNKTFNAYLSDFGVGVMPFSDGSYLFAGTSESYPYQQKTAPNKGGDDYWLLKVDVSGNIIWDKTIGGNDDDKLREIIKTNDGNFILAGTSASGKSFDKSVSSKGSDDYWIVKIDVNGNKIWDKSFGGSSADVLRDIIPTQDGGFFFRWL